MNAQRYIISGRKRGTRQRFALIEPTDYEKAQELERPVAKAALSEFAGIRINRYREDKPFPYYDITELYSRKGGGQS